MVLEHMRKEKIIKEATGDKALANFFEFLKITEAYASTDDITMSILGKNIIERIRFSDKVTSKNKEKYLLKENSYYTLEKPKKTKNFKGWYNTGDGKIYKPGSKVKIYHGTHFVASYNKN